MGTENGQPVGIDLIVVDTHANPNEFAVDPDDGSFFNTNDVQKLDDKNIDAIILLGCNTGHLDYRYDNMAASFAQKYEYTPIVAADGTVWPDHNGVDILYGPKNDKDFQKWLVGDERDNDG